MSLFSMAAADNLALFNQDGEAITLTAPDGTDYEVKGQVTRIEAVIDPQTNLQIREPKSAIAVNLMDVGATPAIGWTAETIDGAGNVITGRIAEVRIDYTLQMVNIILEIFEETYA